VHEAAPLLHAFQHANKEVQEVTSRIFRTVLDGISHYRSFLEHEVRFSGSHLSFPLPPT
jgi:hypothetical protein